jgi:hypothetical protein
MLVPGHIKSRSPRINLGTLAQPHGRPMAAAPDDDDVGARFLPAS